MNLAEDIANDEIRALGARLDGGRAVVFDAAGNELAACDFASPAFKTPEQGRAVAHPLRIGVGTGDGAPASFEAYTQAGSIVMVGSAGHRDDEPKPEMRFKVRQIVRDADVSIDAFEISIPNIISRALTEPVDSGAAP